MIIFTFLAVVPPFLGLFIWGLWQRSSSGASPKSPYRKGRGKPGRFFSPPWLSPLLAHPAWPLRSTSESMNESQETVRPPCLCCSLDPQSLYYSMMENETGGVCASSSFRLWLLLSLKVIKGLTLSLSACCFNGLLPCLTAQLARSLSQFSRASDKLNTNDRSFEYS